MAEYSIKTTSGWSWKNFFFQWEWLLALVLALIIVMNSIVSPYFLSLETFLNVPMTFLDQAFIVFPMMLVILTGNIDISVASTVALSSVVMAVSYNAGLPMPAAIALCLLAATVCGLVNGLLLAAFKELSAMIITLSTMIIYRGIAYIILEDQAAGKFPEWFSFFGWGNVGPLPFIFLCFIVCAVLYGILIHKTTFGRQIYGMGSNKTACLYSGVPVNRNLILIYTLNGLMSGITAIFLASRMGSTRPNIASGYELSVIAMVVLGGVSTAGGRGRIGGPILAVFIIGFLSYGLGLVNAQAQMVMIIIGLLLILSVLVQNLGGIRKKGRQKHKITPAAPADTL